MMTDSFADEEGAIVPASHYGMPGEWPKELEITVMLEKDEHGKTKMTLRHVGLPAGDTATQCTASWNESFDKLMEILK